MLDSILCLLIMCVSVSDKLTIRQANRRNNPIAKAKKVKEPFFTGTGKNALIITGSWLVCFTQHNSETLHRKGQFVEFQPIALLFRVTGHCIKKQGESRCSAIGD